jgi:hypothetical protein
VGGIAKVSSLHVNIDRELFDKITHNQDIVHGVYDAAKLYITMGWRILPIKVGTKSYFNDMGIEYASDDIEDIERWFNPQTGQYKGANILGVCPRGILAYDFDIHGQRDSFKSLGIEPNDLNGLRVRTPTGGFHLYASDAVVPMTKNLKGVEKKTFCMLPPSRIKGLATPYAWDTGGAPGELPPLVLAAMGGKKASKKEEPLETFAEVASTEYLQELLSHFDPGCDHQEWAMIGMALHDNDPGEGHLGIWIDWSKLSPEKFQEGLCEKKWASFSNQKARKVTLAWMLSEARKRGRVPAPSDMKYSGVNMDAYEATVRMNKNYMYTRQGGPSVIRIDKGPDGYERYTRLGAGDFKNMDAANLPPIMAGERAIPAAKHWLDSRFRREGNMVMEYPEDVQEGDINMFQGLAIKPVPSEPSEIQFFLDHTLNVICAGNQEHCDFLLDILAAKMQRPLDLIGIAIVLKGREGTGKSSFGEVIRLIIGEANSGKATTSKALVGDFSGGMAGKIFVVGEEAVFSPHKGQAERLKAMITETPLDWERKGVDVWSQRNCILLLVTTNENWAIPAGQDSRRFFVLAVSDLYMGKTAYWRDQYMPLLGKNHRNEPNNPEYLGKVLYYLLNRKVKSDLTRALVTEELKEQRKLTNIDSFESVFVEWARQLFVKVPQNTSEIEGSSGYFTFSVVTYKGERWIEYNNLYTDLRRHYNKFNSKGRGVGTEKEFKDRLEAIGMVGMRVKIRSLRMGAASYPGPPENKINIVRLPDDLETKLAAQYPQFTESFDEADE